MLNRAIVKKISAMLSLMLIIAVMVPVLAFAASVGLSSVTYKNSAVTGTVYTDVYAQGVNDAVYVHVYGDNDSNNVTTVKATYSSLVDGKYYFTFSTPFSGGYGSVNVSSSVYSEEGVFYATYQPYGKTSDSTHRNGGGGGGGFFPGADGSISISSDGSVDANSLANALANGDVTLKLVGDTASIPASALLDAEGKTLTITNDNGTYILPISALKLEAMAASVGVEVKDLIVKVTIAKVTGSTADDIKTAVTTVGGNQVSDAVDFRVDAVGNGQTAAADFGKTYVARSVKLSKAVDSSKTTGVLYNETTKKVSFVPATFSTSDGDTVATLKRNGSSIYTVVEMDKSFTDVASHWSKADVELLANKLVVDGATDTTFQPDRNITRAEFAALVVRSLGLTDAPAASNFTDVDSSAWYASTVATATYAGIINGYEDNTFRPNAQITREELAAMVIRAVDYADVSTNVTNPESVLSKFKDSDKIVWAQKEIAAAVNAGIINGLTDTTIGSAEQATRAQAATMLKRFLSLANFIN